MFPGWPPMGVPPMPPGQPPPATPQEPAPGAAAAASAGSSTLPQQGTDILFSPSLSVPLFLLQTLVNFSLTVCYSTYYINIFSSDRSKFNSGCQPSPGIALKTLILVTLS